MDQAPEKVENPDTIATKFQPSENQKDFLQAAIANCSYKNKSKISEDAGVHRTRWYDWLKEDGFPEWFYSEFNRAIQFKVHELDTIGFRLAETDFKYWEAMQKKYGGLAVSKPGVNVNVSANANAEAKTEISLGTEEAKERLSRNLGILSRYGHLSQLISKN